jgi:ribosomal 50S subunit-associated protein YjgA (DUF615 family)
MATDAKAEMSAAELLHFYLGLRLQKGDGQLPIRQILAEFPDYLRQRDAMRGLVREAENAIAAGRSGPLNIEQAIHEVIQELSAEGISD